MQKIHHVNYYEEFINIFLKLFILPAFFLIYNLIFIGIYYSIADEIIIIKGGKFTMPFFVSCFVIMSSNILIKKIINNSIDIFIAIFIFLIFLLTSCVPGVTNINNLGYLYLPLHPMSRLVLIIFVLCFSFSARKLFFIILHKYNESLQIYKEKFQESHIFERFIKTIINLLLYSLCWLLFFYIFSTISLIIQKLFFLQKSNVFNFLWHFFFLFFYLFFLAGLQIIFFMGALTSFTWILFGNMYCILSFLLLVKFIEPLMQNIIYSINSPIYGGLHFVIIWFLGSALITLLILPFYIRICYKKNTLIKL